MLRVLHAPVNIGNQPWVLSRQERALGICSDLVVKHGRWLQYPADRFLNTSPQMTWRDRLRRVAFGLLSPFRYDVLHYYFGQSFLGSRANRGHWHNFIDLKLASRLNRKIFMTLQGCDVRLSDRSDHNNRITMCRPGHCSEVASCRAGEDEGRRWFIQAILPRCDRVFILNPDLAHVAPGAVFLPYANVDVEASVPHWPKTEGPITLLHAPSDEGIKGTRFIVDAVERLKKRWPIELVLVRGLPHAEALKRYRAADLVIDQVLLGWYGGFAVEVMAMGKPVACYLREDDLGVLPQAMRAELPVRKVNPETLEDDLEALLAQRGRWPEWGRQARAFVLRWHHPRRIAQAMVRAYREPGAPFVLEVDIESQEAPRCAA